MKKNDLLTSLLCTALFAAIVVGCGGSDSSTVISSITNKFHVATKALAGSSMYSGSGVNTQALFQNAAPIVLSQSVHGVCKIPTSLTIPTGDFVPISGFGRVGRDNCNTFFSQPQAGTGERMLDDGTLSTLVVLGDPGASASGGTVTLYVNGVATNITCNLGTGTRCDDRTHTLAVKNNDLVQPYFIQGAGDKISDIEVLFLRQ